MKRLCSLIIIVSLLISFIPVSNIEAKTKEEKVVQYANKFVGNPYRWGGNSLTKGCDCSGFVVQVYKKFGVNLSSHRSSYALRSVGKKVSVNKIKKGDIICYPHHVAIYRGKGKIVEAQSKRAGITNNRNIRKWKIITVRRVL